MQVTYKIRGLPETSSLDFLVDSYINEAGWRGCSDIALCHDKIKRMHSIVLVLVDIASRNMTRKDVSEITGIPEINIVELR